MLLSFSALCAEANIVVAVRNNHSLMLVNPGEDLHLANPLESLRKTRANAMMWDMAVDGFKTMGLGVEARP